MSYQHHLTPELFRDSRLFQAEQTSGLPLRLALLGLACTCDKAGRFRWRPDELKQYALPYDDVSFEKILHTLVEQGYLLRYSYEAQSYGAIAVPPKTRRRYNDSVTQTAQ